MSKEVYYRDYDGRKLVKEEDLRSLGGWETDPLIKPENFYKINKIGHIIIRIIKRDDDLFYVTIKKLWEPNKELVTYFAIELKKVSSLMEAKLKSEIMAREFGYKQEMTLGLNKKK